MIPLISLVLLKIGQHNIPIIMKIKTVGGNSHQILNQTSINI